MLNKDHPLPKYYQLKELLLEKIVGGEWLPGTMIPSERDLSGEYDISRMTARQALAELTSEGLLRREQGRGTFVAERKIHQGLSRLSGFTEDMTERGLQAGGKVVQCAVKSAPPAALRPLQLTPGQEVVILERLRNADGEAVALEKSHLHFPHVQELLRGNLENDSLYQLLAEKFEIVPTRAEQQVGADLCTAREQKLLGLSSGAPILRIQRTTYDQWGRPFEYTEAAYRADRYIFLAELVLN
jgi:GntR family transcriptional regulator